MAKITRNRLGIAMMPCWNGKLDWYWMYTCFAHLWVSAKSRDHVNVPKRTNWEWWHCGTLAFSPVMYIKGSHRCLHNPSEERYRWIGLCPEEAVKSKWWRQVCYWCPIKARCMELEDLLLTVGSLDWSTVRLVNLKLSVKWVLQQDTR